MIHELWREKVSLMCFSVVMFRAFRFPDLLFLSSTHYINASVLQLGEISHALRSINRQEQCEGEAVQLVNRFNNLCSGRRNQISVVLVSAN